MLGVAKTYQLVRSEIVKGQTQVCPGKSGYGAISSFLLPIYISYAKFQKEEVRPELEALFLPESRATAQLVNRQHSDSQNGENVVRHWKVKEN